MAPLKLVLCGIGKRGIDHWEISASWVVRRSGRSNGGKRGDENDEPAEARQRLGEDLRVAAEGRRTMQNGNPRGQ